MASPRMQRADHARQLMREGKAREALAVLEPALRVDARNQELLSLAARAHLMQGAMSQAVATATRALAVGPHPEPLMVRGDALRSLGHSDEAVADFEAAVRLQPAHAELRVMLASSSAASCWCMRATSPARWPRWIARFRGCVPGHC